MAVADAIGTRGTSDLNGTATQVRSAVASHAGNQGVWPGRYPEIATVNELFLRVADSGRPDAMLWQDAAGSWKPISSSQIYGRVRALAAAFSTWGIGHGDRVALLSENRWEWAITDFAVLTIGAVDVPIYPTLTAEQLGLLLVDSGAKAIVVSSRAQLEKARSVLDGTAVEHVVVMDEIEDLRVDSQPGESRVSGARPGAPARAMVLFSSLMKGADELGRDAEFEALARSVKAEDLATLIYTSGTTGEPKGVMLTHGNIASNTSHSTCDFGFNSTDGCISFLPLSHITARALDYAMMFAGAQIAYCPKFEELPARMQEVRPTVFVGVPRVYEKIRQGVEAKSAVSMIKAGILKWAVKTGAGYRDAVHDRKRPRTIAWRIAEKLVYRKICEAFGGRVKTFVSGGAPLGIDTGNWFASVGISILEGYGLTETSPVIAINTPLEHRMGTVGKPLPIVECKLAADGELLVRGSGVFKGYWRKPEETAAVIDGDGWCATGDIGRIDADGFLSITDRKKELLKTSGGKLIAPQPIEGKLKTNTLVAEAALVGDRHKFICVLISPNFAALEAWAAGQGIGAMARRDLVADSRVEALYGDIVAKVNEKLANFETMKRFRVVADEWTLGTGELTPSMKLKRRVITERYSGLIADLYADEATARGESV
jgi:long-chain acyl-CoA synthetase